MDDWEIERAERTGHEVACWGEDDAAAQRARSGHYWDHISVQESRK